MNGVNSMNGINKEEDLNKKERAGTVALALLISGIVFITNTVVMLLTIVAVYGLAHLGFIETAGGQVGLPGVMKFFFYVSLIIGFLLASLIGKITFKPIKRIIDQLDRLASGDFKARLHFGKPISLHPSFKKIEKSFNRAAEELEHTEMLRSDFINNFSHEFKTPIVSIAGFAKLLRRGNLTDEQKEEYLEVIEEESLRLSAMANKVLNLTRVENQTILTEVTSFNLSEQIRGAVLLLAEKWTEKNLYMDMQFDEHMISANEELLKQVWINLLDNAIKFSEPGGTVTVGILEEDDRYSVSVSNSCKDIPKDCIAHIFNKFYQADESHSSQGNGIGLAVVKKVCELHGGAVSAKSEGGTTTFTVLLPKQQNI